jgi:hypothetical protein
LPLCSCLSWCGTEMRFFSGHSEPTAELQVFSGHSDPSAELNCHSAAVSAGSVRVRCRSTAQAADPRDKTEVGKHPLLLAPPPWDAPSGANALASFPPACGGQGGAEQCALTRAVRWHVALRRGSCSAKQAPHPAKTPLERAVRRACVSVTTT